MVEPQASCGAAANVLRCDFRKPLLDSQLTRCWAEEETLDRRLTRELARLARGEIAKLETLTGKRWLASTPPDLGNPSGKIWSIIVTAPSSERIATDWLVRRGFAAYAPTWEKRLRRRKTSVLVKRPLFPRYVFVGQEPDCRRFVEIEATIGVAALVRVAGVPVTISESVVAKFRELETRGCFVEGSDGRVRIVAPGMTPDQRDALANGVYAAGELVRIVGGSFADHLGRIVRTPERDRIQVLVDLFGRQTTMDVALDEIISEPVG